MVMGAAINACQRCGARLMRSGAFLADGVVVVESCCVCCGNREWADTPYKPNARAAPRDGLDIVLEAVDDMPDVVDLMPVVQRLAWQGWTLADVEAEVRRRGYVTVGGSGEAYRKVGRSHASWGRSRVLA